MKQIFSFKQTILCIITCSVLMAQGYKLKAQEYTLTDNDVVVEEGIIQSCSYDFSITDIIIPETLDGQTVIGIASKSSRYSGVFYNKGITGITLPATIETIGDYAFSKDKIDKLDLSSCPALNYIGEEAFYYNPITTVNFSGCNNLEKIGNEAFQKHELTNLDLSECTALKTIGSEAFYAYTLTTLNISGCAALELIDDQAFYGNIITALDLSNCSSLKHIGEEAFYSNEIESINLTGCTSLESFGYSAFRDNKISQVDFSPCTSLAVVGWSSFADNAITNVNFQNCTALTAIDRYAFGNNSLASIDLSPCTNLAAIGESAFYSNSLTGFNLPVISTQNREFKHWTNGKTLINNGAYVENLDYGYFAIFTPNYEPANGELTVENGIIVNHQIDLQQHPDILIPETYNGQTIKGIGDSLFYNNYRLVSIGFPSSLQTIGEASFYRAFLNNADFNSCSSLKEIDASAFQYCSLNNISFEACTSLEKIGAYAFNYNYITSLYMGACKPLSIIGEGAFSYNDIYALNINGCENLKKIQQAAFKANYLASIDFTGTTSLEEISEEAFYKNNLNNVDLHTCISLISIGTDAFYDNNLTELTLPTPGYPGTVFNQWYDISGNGHSGGSTVSNLYSWYKADFETPLIFLSDMRLDFGSVNAGNYSSRTLKLSNHSADTIQIDTILMASEVYSLSTSSLSNKKISPWREKTVYIYFRPTQPGNYNDSAFIICPDAIGKKSLFLIGGSGNNFSVNFTITDGASPIQNAVVKLAKCGEKYTDAQGVAIFDKVYTENNISYTVSAEGYTDVSGILSVVDKDVNKQINLIATGIKDISSHRFTIYPNPADRYLSISFSSLPTSYIIELYNSSGQVILKQQSSNQIENLAIEKVVPGIYYLKISDSLNSKTEKIIIE